MKCSFYNNRCGCAFYIHKWDALQQKKSVYSLRKMSDIITCMTVFNFSDNRCKRFIMNHALFREHFSNNAIRYNFNCVCTTGVFLSLPPASEGSVLSLIVCSRGGGGFPILRSNGMIISYDALHGGPPAPAYKVMHHGKWQTSASWVRDLSLNFFEFVQSGDG